MRCMYWDGWAKREVVITVVEDNTGNSIADATVTLKQENVHKSTFDHSRLNATTGPDGSAILQVFFAGGGRKCLFTNEVSFGISGVLNISADGYSPLTEPLASLVGKEHITERKRSAIHVRVNLTKKD